MSTDTQNILTALTEAISGYQRVPGLLAEIERLGKLLTDRDDTISLQQMEIDALNVKLDTRDEHINHLKADVAQLYEERRGLQDENAGLRSELDHTTNVLTDARRVIALSEASIACLESEIHSLKIALDDSQSLATKFKSTLDRIFGEVAPVSAPAPEVATSSGFPGSDVNPLDNPMAGIGVPPLAPSERVPGVITTDDWNTFAEERAASRGTWY